MESYCAAKCGPHIQKGSVRLSYFTSLAKSLLLANSVLKPKKQFKMTRDPDDGSGLSDCEATESP